MTDVTFWNRAESVSKQKNHCVAQRFVTYTVTITTQMPFLILLSNFPDNSLKFVLQEYIKVRTLI